MAHNKTLAAQLYHEFRGFFPQNAVEYFVSYYDYYQPEAYIASTDTYIEKESTINDEIDRLRLSATRSLFERRDVLIVASVSCIYGLGSPEAYYGMLLCWNAASRCRAATFSPSSSRFSTNATTSTSSAERFGFAATRSKSIRRMKISGFASSCGAMRSKSSSTFDPLTGDEITVARPSDHLSEESLRDAAAAHRSTRSNDQGRTRGVGNVARRQGRLLEAQRLHQRTLFDMEMIKEIGYCHGIENYSRHLTGTHARASRRRRCSTICRRIR